LRGASQTPPSRAPTPAQGSDGARTPETAQTAAAIAAPTAATATARRRVTAGS